MHTKISEYSQKGENCSVRDRFASIYWDCSRNQAEWGFYLLWIIEETIWELQLDQERKHVGGLMGLFN